MNHVDGLVLLNGRLLRAFSARTTAALRAGSALRLALPHLEPLLASNVDKEVRKDALVIRAAQDLVAQAGASEGVAAQLLEAGKAIDREFLRRLEGLPIRLEISYARVAPIRLRRIERLLHAASRLLAHWPPRATLRSALQGAYTRESFEQELAAILRLYADETRALTTALRLPLILAPLADRVARRLDEVMARVGARLATDVGALVYRRRSGA